MAKRPNVVLIMVDQWRGDCLGIDGHPTVQTRSVNQLALRGTRFGRAYSTTPSCVPARISLFTGLRAPTHGFVGFNDKVRWDYPVTLAGEFTRHGYQTQAVGKVHANPPRAQMGFQNVILHSALGIVRDAMQKGHDPGLVDDYIPWLKERLGAQAGAFDHGVDSNSVVARPWDKPEHTHYTNFVAEQSIDLLRRRDTDKPFFLFMSFNAPHPPFDPPAWAFDAYAKQVMPDPPVGDWVDILEPYAQPHALSPQVAHLPPAELQRARAGYYGHITHVDQQIQRFLEALAQYGLTRDTYLCFVSDHGEMLGDHHLFRKSVPYEGSARVPLILVGPPGSGIRSGAATDALVELSDLMPTLLECAGLPIPDGVEGRSFLPLARGESPAWRATLHGEHTTLGQSLQWLTDGREKYIWFSGSGVEQLFDLTVDPTESHDLAPLAEYGERLALWRRRLVEALDGREEDFVQGGALVAGRPVNACLRHLRERAVSGD
ncbi:MAG TPA: arylsulfatase [Limnochordia bacterium]|nr:arylsulfatase [Limnochordia bacterium]